MSDPLPLLDRAGIEDAFRRLSERLARRGVGSDLYVFEAYERYEALACQRARLDCALSAAQSVQAELPLPIDSGHFRVRYSRNAALKDAESDRKSKN